MHQIGGRHVIAQEFEKSMLEIVTALLSHQKNAPHGLCASSASFAWRMLKLYSLYDTGLSLV